MSFFKRQPEYLDRQSNATKAKSALLEKFRANQESDEDFAKRQANLLEIRIAREEREAKRKAEAEAAQQAELERLAKLKAEEEARAAELAAEQKARRDARYASRKKRKKGLRYARPTGAPTSGATDSDDED
jgi:monoamine oxidase